MITQTIRAAHRGYYYNLEQDQHGWFISAIQHAYDDSKLVALPFPCLNRATAEEIARRWIDFQLSEHFQADGD